MILVLGGTRDSVLLAQKLYEVDQSIIYSTATEYGSYMVDRSFKGKIIFGRKNIEELCNLVKENAVTIIVDATHPYASDISINAIKVCRQLGIKYIRYERPSTVSYGANVVLFKDFEEAAEYAEGLEGRMFLTTGTKDIKKILSKISDKKRVVARVLPWSESIIHLEKLGLNPDNIIAMKGPFSEEMNYLMLKESGSKIMIIKDSGTAGGIKEKLAAAERLRIIVLLVKRPEIEYPNKYNSEEEIIKELRK